MTLNNLGLLAIAMTLIVLTSCGGSSTTKLGNLNIYQPSTLNLSKGVPIQSKEGVYTPQTDEVWHSDARFRKLERELYFKPTSSK